MSHVLVIEGLRANVGGQEILRGIDLEVHSGEVHAVMGPNGSGKSTLSHVIAGRPGYQVTGGRVTLDGVDLLGPAGVEAGPGRAVPGHAVPHRGARREPGRRLERGLRDPWAGRRRWCRTCWPPRRTGWAWTGASSSRPLNVDLSGGERKRNETVQLGVIGPLFAVLDEIDSGLDVDALRAVARRIEAATAETGLGVLAITHYNRLLHELHADRIHVLSGGRIVASGGPELAEELETTGYAAYGADEPVGGGAGGRRPLANGARARPADIDPFADPFA